MFDWNALWQQIISWIATVGLKLIIALVILAISFRLITVLNRRIQKRIVESGKLDRTVSSVLVYSCSIALKILIAVCLVNFVGIDTSGITALITSLGVCVGLAVNGALSNLAGGVMLLITRPFRIGDFVKVGQHEGYVEDIRIINTVIRKMDNSRVYLPNGTLSAGEIVNCTAKGVYRLEKTFAVSYKADIPKAKELILDVCRENECFLQEPDEPLVYMDQHSESSIVLFCRVWIKAEDYWTAPPILLEKVKEAFDKNGIEIPYNQLDVHIR